MLELFQRLCNPSFRAFTDSAFLVRIASPRSYFFPARPRPEGREDLPMPAAPPRITLDPTTSQAGRGKGPRRGSASHRRLAVGGASAPRSGLTGAGARRELVAQAVVPGVGRW